MRILRRPGLEALGLFQVVWFCQRWTLACVGLPPGVSSEPDHMPGSRDLPGPQGRLTAGTSKPEDTSRVASRTRAPPSPSRLQSSSRKGPAGSSVGPIS